MSNQRIFELKVENIELEKKAEYLEKEKVLEVEKERILQKETQIELGKELASLKATNEQLKERLKESPYKQLENLLKALAVKLPTVDIKSLSVATKSK